MERRATVQMVMLGFPTDQQNVVLELEFELTQLHHRFVMGNRTMNMHVIASSKTKRESTDVHKYKCMTQNYRTV